MKKIKRIIIGILIFITCITNVYAANTFTININGNSDATKGSTIVLTFNVSNASGIASGFAGYEGFINFDTTVFKYLSSAKSDTNWNLIATKINDGRYKMVGYDNAPPSSSITNSGNIFTITLEVLATAPIGSSDVTFTDIKGSSGVGTPPNPTPTSTTFSKTITIKDQAPVLSSNNTLSNLTVTTPEGALGLSPSFSAQNLTYSITVENDVTEVTLNATTTDSKATLSGTGLKTLNVGSNTNTITVTAEDGTKKNYVVTITRKAILSSNSSLKGLTVDGKTIIPTFNSNTTTYELSVPNNVSSITVNAIKADPKAIVTITGNTNLSVGINNVIVEVKAEDGSKSVYTIYVTKEKADGSSATSTKSSNADLSKIEFIGKLAPSFNKNITSYDLTVPFEVSKLDLKAFTDDPKAKVMVVGGDNLAVGVVSPITVIVTAENGAIKTYTFNVTRAAFESESYLKDLTVKDYDLSPSFDRSVTNYEIDVPSNVNKLDISAIAEFKGSNVKIIGNKNLKQGENTILVEVTDKNGFTRTYKIIVNKASNNENILTKYWLPILIGLLFLILIIVIIFVLKGKNNNSGGGTVIYNTTNNNNNDNGDGVNTIGSGDISADKNKELLLGAREEPKVIESNYHKQLEEKIYDAEYNDYIDKKTLNRYNDFDDNNERAYKKEMKEDDLYVPKHKEDDESYPNSSSIVKEPKEDYFQDTNTINVKALNVISKSKSDKTEQSVSKILQNPNVDNVKKELTVTGVKEVDGEMVEQEYKVTTTYKKKGVNNERE